MWNAEELRSAAQMRGLSLVTAETFAVGQQSANGVRISLGGPETTALMGDALHAVAELIGQAPRAGATVV